MLLREPDFRGRDAVVVVFMRSGVVRENDDPLRFAKHICLVAVFSGAVRSVASVGVEDGTFFEGNLGRLAGLGALVEQVGARLATAAHSSVALSETTVLPALYEFEEARHLCRTPSLNSVRSP